MARSARNIAGNTKVLANQKLSTDAKCVSFVEKGENWIKVMLPIFTAAESNGGVKKSYIVNGKTVYKNEHWTEKHRRTQLQKGTVFLMLRPHRDRFSLPCT